MTDKNLLMIDDNPAMLSAAETALQGIYNSVLTSSGRSGIEAFQANRPDVVVLDMRLPDLNGLEVLSTLKKIDPSVPVIILTAVDDTSVASKAIRAGAFTYLTKPMELQSLLSIIQEASSNSPIANNVILPSIVTKDLFQQLAYEYAKRSTIVLLGEEGVGKRTMARAVHRRFHGSDHSFLLVSAASLGNSNPLAQSSEVILTACINTVLTEASEYFVHPGFSMHFRKIIITVEIPSFDRNSELRAEFNLSKKWKTITVPPLRSRKREAFPLLCYWHQKIAPEKNLDKEVAYEEIRRLERASFPGNVGDIVGLARKMALC